ncbi:MAG: short-chain dehydrogenase [Chthoniobacteraceae bacterium]|nr:short-chain dehydrogenase [Chthoniobacteraceae bacterium]
MINFKDCTALITGASSGIGTELARQLAPQAKCLLLVARRTDRLEELRVELGRPGLAIHCFTTDLADDEATGELLVRIEATGERVTFLINNAGLGDHGLFDQSNWAKVKAMIDVNITALTRLTYAFVPQLVAARQGAILNVSSIASLMPMPKMAVYGATKAYVTSFSEALRVELQDAGVTVTAVCPGPVDTEFSQVANRADAPPVGSGSSGKTGLLKVPLEQVVREALDAVARDRARVIPGWKLNGIMTLASSVPASLLRRMRSGVKR